MTDLSRHFTYEEMTVTHTGLPNVPEEPQMDNLRRTANRMDAIRDLLQHPVTVSSGFRSPEVNRAVGGVSNDAHEHGYGCDFVCPRFGTPADVAREIARSDIAYDQLILEYGWVHISFDPRLRMEKMTKRSASAPYETGLNT